MNKRTIRVLEFEKILEMLAVHAVSQGAKKRCRRLTPRKELTEIAQLQSETRDAARRWEEYGAVGFSGVREITDSLRLLEMGSPLNQSELLDIASLLETADQVQSYGARREAPEPDTLTDRFSSLLPVRDVSSEIRRCILSEEDMADDASSNLKKIRKEILTCGSQLHQQLEKIVKRESDKGTLQDALITMRGGR